MEKFLMGIVALLFFKVCFSLRVFTPNIQEHAFPLARMGFTVANITQLRFKLKACGNGHLILQKDEVVDFNTYGSWTFVLGSSGNTKSDIRSAVYGSKYSRHNEAVLDCTEFRTFWIRWKGGLLELGKGSEFGISRISSFNRGAPFGFNYAFALTGWGSDGCWDIDTGLAMLASTWKKFPGNKKLLGSKVLSYHNRSLIECTLQCTTPTEYLQCGCVKYSYNMVTKQCLVVDASGDITMADEVDWNTWNLM